MYYTIIIKSKTNQTTNNVTDQHNIPCCVRFRVTI